MNIWKKIEEMRYFARQKVFDNPDITDEWHAFDGSTDIHIEKMDHWPVGGFQAIAYPIDGKGETVTNGTYIQLF